VVEQIDAVNVLGACDLDHFAAPELAIVVVEVDLAAIAEEEEVPDQLAGMDQSTTSVVKGQPDMLVLEHMYREVLAVEAQDHIGRKDCDAATLSLLRLRTRPASIAAVVGT
jgi:hypothetical protein